MTDKRTATNLSASEDDGAQCLLDNVWVHSIEAYLKSHHPEVSLQEYQSRFPGAPLHSPSLEIARKRKELELAMVTGSKVVKLREIETDTDDDGGLKVIDPVAVKKDFAEVFGLGSAPAAMSAKGTPIMIDVLGDCGPTLNDYIPDTDANYVFDIDNLKAVMMAVVINKPMLAWGMHGTGKTTLLQQYAARTGRPTIRVQHTVSTEESHILGQYVVRDGSTVFEPGPLAFAMRYGLIYIADEYDFALPSVTSVYQPVLEGQRLIIKEAPPSWRVVKPHPNFRFFATGNTNGGGDETGLYQGTQLQNAANYSRFGITIEVGYMPEKMEVMVIQGQSRIFEAEAKKLVELARHVRQSYQSGEIGVTISPRELINAAILSRTLGGKMVKGLELAYTNRLNKTDRAAVNAVIQRIFGS